MTTITEMPDTELGKNVDAFALAVERYIGNEAGLEATRAHVAMLREAARRLLTPVSATTLQICARGIVVNDFTSSIQPTKW